MKDVESPVTLFTWGYWGWGSATRELVDAAAAVERARGFGPPLFVDLRRLRDVRAVGFRGDAFEKTAGRDSYRWMPGLGNLAVETHSGPAIQIAEPAAADDLLQLVLDAAAEGRRIIAFCACEFAVSSDGSSCHRVTVAALTRDAAARRGVPLVTVEWPGGEPVIQTVAVDERIARAVARGTRSSIPLGRGLPPVELCGSPVESPCRIPGALVLTRPARAGVGGWSLPISGVFQDGVGEEEALRTSRERRREGGYEPVPSFRAPAAAAAALNARSGHRARHAACVYTIAHGDRLRDVAAAGGAATFEEKRPWATGLRLLARAREANEDLVVVFSDATDCVQLIYWGVITNIEVHDGARTTFEVERLQPIHGDHVTQDLRLLSSGKNIAEGYIRPYAPCHTPEFL